MSIFWLKWRSCPRVKPLLTSLKRHLPCARTFVLHKLSISSSAKLERIRWSQTYWLRSALRSVSTSKRLLRQTKSTPTSEATTMAILQMCLGITLSTITRWPTCSSLMDRLPLSTIKQKNAERQSPCSKSLWRSLRKQSLLPTRLEVPTKLTLTRRTVKRNKSLRLWLMRTNRFIMTTCPRQMNYPNLTPKTSLKLSPSPIS